MRAKLEICIDSLGSAINAYNGGCNRLEVCSALSLGGLTPTAGLIQAIDELREHAEVAANRRLEVAIMIRPRSGNFVYNEKEKEQMNKELAHIICQVYSIDLVLGALNPDNTLDRTTLQNMINFCKDSRGTKNEIKFTLHRCFDLTPNWREAVDIAAEIGFNYILTSGLRATAMEGKENLVDIVQYARSKGIQIIVGSGVSSRNIKELYSKTGANYYHASASVVVMVHAPFPMGRAETEELRETSRIEVEAIRKALDETILIS